MPAIDKFASNPKNLISPSEDFLMVTPSDSVDLTYVSREITVGTAGDLAVIDMHGVTIVILSAIWSAQPVQAIRVTRVLATGTTAVGIFVKT